jgi:hypothetical protein
MKKINIKHKLSVFILMKLISAVGFYGCGQSVTPTLTDNLSFSVMSSMDSVGDSQQDILVLDTVKVLIKDIKLNVANGNQDSTNFRVGPFVLFLNMSGAVKTITSSFIPAGEYEKIKFEVHKLNSDEVIPDPEFADAGNRYSVIVKGTYLGERFVFKSDKSAHQLLSFPNTLTIPVNADVPLNITMIIKPYIWFIEDGVYLDPREISNSNDIENNIKDNINQNFKAFRDNDKNGISD